MYIFECFPTDHRIRYLVVRMPDQICQPLKLINTGHIRGVTEDILKKWKQDCTQIRCFYCNLSYIPQKCLCECKESLDRTIGWEFMMGAASLTSIRGSGSSSSCSSGSSSSGMTTMGLTCSARADARRKFGGD